MWRSLHARRSVTSQPQARGSDVEQVYHAAAVVGHRLLRRLALGRRRRELLAQRELVLVRLRVRVRVRVRVRGRGRGRVRVRVRVRGWPAAACRSG